MEEGSPLDEAVACVERTLGADSARIGLHHEMDASLPSRRPRRRGGLLRPFVRLAAMTARRAWEEAGRRWTTFSSEGFIEPSRRRHMVAVSQGWAMMLKDGRLFNGRPGQPLATLEPAATKAGPAFDPWFVLDALRGLEVAALEGEEIVRGTSCRRLAVRVDIARASGATLGGVRPPEVDRYEELLALPLTVWTDGTHVRRVRFEAGISTLHVELWDFGVPTNHLDWSRLPRT